MSDPLKDPILCPGSGGWVDYPDWVVQGGFYTVNCEHCEAWWVVDTNAMTFDVPEHRPE